jgi:ABC-type branched-subunit amino acid transport system substrate-binding protein
MAARYRSLFGGPPPPAALFGYEAMRGVLAAIGRAGPAANDRHGVVDAYFRTTASSSVLGPYAIDSRGDTTLGRYGGFADHGGRLVLERLLGTQD